MIIEKEIQVVESGLKVAHLFHGTLLEVEIHDHGGDPRGHAEESRAQRLLMVVMRRMLLKQQEKKEVLE